MSCLSTTAIKVMMCVCRVLSIFEAKGGGRKGRFQGRATRLENRHKAEELLRGYQQPPA